MVLCEHFIFTSASVKEKSGYQVISKSSKINSKFLEQLEDYMYPLGLEPSKFSESKSMLVMDEKIVFTKAQNIGIGFDGRPDTTYSHTIIMAKEEFRKFQNDSQVFNELYILKKKSEHLAPLVIEPKKSIPNFSCINILGIAQFKDFLLAVIDKKRIAILNSYDENLIQSLLSLLPSSLKLISFSSMVLQPQRQSKYDLIQTQSSKKLLKKYFIIDVKERKTIELSENTLFDQCINYLLDIIDTKNSQKLIEIFEEIEEIQYENDKEKFVLIIGTKLLDANHPYLTNESSLEELVTAIGNIPISISNKYWLRVKEFLTLEQHKRYALKFEIEQVINEHNGEDLVLETLVSMFHSLQNNNLETREKLLERLFQRREESIIKNGILLLTNVNYSIYKNEIIDLFIKKENLNSIIFKIFDEQTDLTQIQKQSMYDELIKRSLPVNSIVVLELLQKKVFDFTNEYEIKHFRRLLEQIFESKSFLKNVNKKKMVQIIEHLFQKFEDITNYKQKSGIIGITDNNLKQIRKTIRIFEKLLESVGDKENKEIQDLKKNLSSFLEKNQIQIREEKPLWSWGWK